MKKILKSTFALLPFLFITTGAFCNNPEPLLGVSLNYEKKEITITVVTTGCTGKNDFRFVINNGALTIIRDKKDFCKAMPDAISFTYSLKEAGIDPNKPFIITNSFIANAFVVNIN